MKMKFGLTGTNSLAEEMDFPVPKNFGNSELAMMEKDGELLSAFVRENSDTVLKILEASNSGDHELAAKLTREVGFTEQRFIDEGGGLLLALAVGAAMLLYSQSAY